MKQISRSHRHCRVFDCCHSKLIWCRTKDNMRYINVSLSTERFISCQRPRPTSTHNIEIKVISMRTSLYRKSLTEVSWVKGGYIGLQSMYASNRRLRSCRVYETRLIVLYINILLFFGKVFNTDNDLTVTLSCLWSTLPGFISAWEMSTKL